MSHRITTSRAMPIRITSGAISCNVCGAREHELFLERSGYRICQCSSCGLRFLSPQPTAKEVQDYYDAVYFGNKNSSTRGYDAYVADADLHRATFRNRLRLMPAPKAGDRLLDVGAAAGYFVEQARLAGWDAEGVEPSAWATEYATQVLTQPVRNGTLESARFPDSVFDAITLWEVIEHLPDPRAVISEAARVLRRGGHLILSTPDAGSAVARLFGRRWLGWNKVPEHLFYFDRKNLTQLLRENGFTVTWWSYVSITVTASFAARRLGELLGLPSVLRRLP